MRALVFLLLWLGICLYAIVRGGRPEQLAAGVFLIGGPVSAFAASSAATRFLGIEAGVLLTDVVMLVALVAIALRAHRLWPMPLAALQILQVGGHMVKLGDPTVFPLVYWFTNVIWAYPMLLLLGLGTWHYRDRRSRGIMVKPWSTLRR